MDSIAKPKMCPQIKPKYFLISVGKIFYLIMLGVGIYLIYQGEVIEKYQQKLTRRNYYEQELTELPSIVTILEYHDPQLKKDIYLDFEKDYHILFNEGEHLSLENATRLTYGINSLRQSDFDVRVENYRNHIGVSITLMNFLSGLPTEYSFIYSVENDTMIPKLLICLLL